MSFAHNHYHDEGSDGLGTFEQAIQHVTSIGQDALAITNHGTFNTIPAGYAYTQEYNKKHPDKPFKFNVGIEFYLALDGKRYHLTGLCDGDVGFNNAILIQNKAHERSDKADRRATITLEDLFAHNEGIVVLSGCVASPFHALPEPESISLARRFKSVFHERFFVETMHMGGGFDTWRRSQVLSQTLRIPQIATNDAHFHAQNHAKLHGLLVKMRTGRGNEFAETNTELWLKSEAEMIQRATHFGIENYDKAVNNAYSLAHLLETPTIARPQKLPYINNAFEQLQALAYAGLARIGQINNKEYIDRINYELDVIRNAKFADYFIILHDIVDYGRNSGQVEMEARGSAAGSLVLYCCNITGVDPIVHNLSFDRFLNRLRKGLPDVDMDFDPLGREIIQEYAKTKWKAIPIAAYSTLTKKVIVQRLASILGYDKTLEEEAADDCTGSAYQQLEMDYPMFKEFVKVADGQIFNSSQHAAGMVILPEGMSVPIERMTNGNLAVAYSESSNGAKYLSMVGGVKYDFLVTDAQGMMRRLKERLKVVAPAPENTPKEDIVQMLNLIKSGKIVGLFQFTQAGGQKLLMEMISDATPDNLFERLVVATTINRPAVPKELKKEFHNLMTNPRKVHPLFDKINGHTAGIMIYQEQMMRTFAEITGGGDADADLARRTISSIKGVEDKKNILMVRAMSQVKELEEKFFAKGKELHQMDEQILNQIWLEILASAGYGFNRSHAVAYMHLAWAQLWYALKYPVAFWCEMINMDSDKPKNVFQHVFNAARMGINVRPPHVNVSSHYWEWKDDTIYVPLSQIKGLNNGAEKIIREREANGLFLNLLDFRTRIPKKSGAHSGNCKALYELEAFAGLSGDIKELGIKPEDVDMTLPRIKRELKHLGFIIPKPKLLQFIEERRDGWQGGLIIDKEVRDLDNGLGEYAVLRFVPYAVQSSRPVPHYDVGEIVYFRVKRGISLEYRVVKYVE